MASYSRHSITNGTSLSVWAANNKSTLDQVVYELPIYYSQFLWLSRARSKQKKIRGQGKNLGTLYVMGERNKLGNHS